MFQSPPTSVYNHISSIYHPYINHISSINGKIIIYHISYIIYHISYITSLPSHCYHVILTMSFTKHHKITISQHYFYHQVTETFPSRLSMQVALLLRRLGSHLLPLHLPTYDRNVTTNTVTRNGMLHASGKV